MILKTSRLPDGGTNRPTSLTIVPGSKPRRPKLPDGWPSWYKPIPINSRNVEHVLRGYLNAKEPEAARWLVSTWTAEQEAIKYTEIRTAIRSGKISPAWIERWRQDYSQFVNEVLQPGWAEAAESGGSYMGAEIASLYGIPTFFPETAARMAAVIQERGAALVVNLTNQQRAATTHIIKHFGVTQGLGTTDVARLLRPVIGLTPREAVAVQRLYDAQIASGTEKRIAVRIVQNHSDYLARQRSVRVARTELAFGYNRGAIEGVREAITAGIIKDPVAKRYLTAKDERVCKFCGPLDGEIIELDDTFPGRDIFGFVESPPIHPGCRCTVIYTLLSATGKIYLFYQN